jgi:hypothetical protein
MIMRVRHKLGCDALHFALIAEGGFHTRYAMGVNANNVWGELTIMGLVRRWGNREDTDYPLHPRDMPYAAGWLAREERNLSYCERQLTLTAPSKETFDLVHLMLGPDARADKKHRTIIIECCTERGQ